MTTKLQSPFTYADLSNGLIDDLSVSKGIFPVNAVHKAVNVVFDRPRGGVSQRYGTTAVGGVLTAATIRGLHNFITSGGTNKLLAVAGGNIYEYGGVAWAVSKSGATTETLKTRFLTYLDTVVYMNGSNTQHTSTDGSTWASSGGNLDVASMPTSKFATILNSRVLVAGDPNAPDTIKLSSIVSSNAVSWTSGNKSVVISPNDGAGNLTGVTGNGRVSLLFKQRGLYRYDDNSLERIGYVGTPSYESIATDDNGDTYFFGQGANGIGFYVTNGGRPVKISRAITRYVEGIAASFYTSVSAYTDGRHIEWSVGSITVGDNTYSNASVVYSISDKTWTVFSRADSFRVFSQYIDSSSNITVVGGDTDGNVQTINSGTTDNGSAIYSEVELAGLVFTTRGRTKSVSGVVAMTEHFQGLSLLMKADNGAFEPIAGLTETTQYCGDFKLEGHEFFPKLIASNSGEPWSFTGLEFDGSDVLDEGYQVL